MRTQAAKNLCGIRSVTDVHGLPHRILALGALCLCLVEPVAGQSLFHMRYGSEFMDRANTAIETSDGNYVVAGTTLGFGSSSNAVVMKLNGQGDPIWIRDYSGINADEVFDLIENDQGQILVCGGTNSQGVGNWDGFVMKLDSSGSMLWGRTYGNEYADLLFKIHEDTDGGYIVTGYAQPIAAGPVYEGATLIKLDSVGGVVWNNYVPYGWTAQGGGWYPLDVEILPDSNYLFTTCTSWNGNQLNFYCFSTTGQLLWSKALWVRSQGHKLAVDPMGNIYVTCYEDEGVALSVDLAVLKMDASGNILWFKSYGGTYYEMARDILMSSDGSPVICGVTNSAGSGDYDAFLLKLDNNGSVQWCRTYGTVWPDVPTSISQTADNGFIMAGETYSYGTDPDSLKMYVVRTDSMGNTSCNSSAWPLTQLNDTVASEVPLAIDTLAPQQTSIGWASNYRVFTTTSICGPTQVMEVHDDQVAITAHPNPFQGNLVVVIPAGTKSSVVLRVLDLFGRVVFTDSGVSAREGIERTVDLSNLSNGIYFLEALMDQRTTSIRIIKG